MDRLRHAMKDFAQIGMDHRLKEAFRRFDAENAKDPRADSVDGVERPRELVYGERMTAMLERYRPAASEVLRLAVRAQHLGRWRVPRDTYPMTRAGYHRWRTDLQRKHAITAASILEEVGYGADDIERVCALIQKRNFRSDDEAQCLEDVACLVFLQHYLTGFAAEHGDAKVEHILRRTWDKMSEAGHSAALGLPLDPASRTLIEAALRS